AQLLEEGGPKLWKEFMAELRETHLGASQAGRRKSSRMSVAAKLQAAYEAVVAKRRTSASRR
ncbi:MAG: winged helix-turn-helix transcriptional regulator, partial [Xanthobacteraceae bacterium]